MLQYPVDASTHLNRRGRKHPLRNDVSQAKTSVHNDMTTAEHGDRVTVQAKASR